jgi:hypothetical protein
MAPDGERSEALLGVIVAGIEAARARGGNKLEWERFASLPAYPELRSLLAQWVRDDVVRMRGDWQTAYFVLGDDPGGSALARRNVPAPLVGRLVMATAEALAGPRGEHARAWLESLATSALRDAVPMNIKLELPAIAGGRWTALERLRQAYDGESVSAEAAPEDERRFLGRELEALAQRAPAGTPDLSALRMLLGGELPERALRAVSRWTKASQPGDPRTGRGWLSTAGGRLGLGAPRMPAQPAVPTPGGEAVPGARIRAADAGPVLPGREAHPSAPAADPASAGVQERLREWVLGGTVEEDRTADEQMILLFEQGSPNDLGVARVALEGMSQGMSYRLATRAARNPRLLDAVSLVVGSAMLDRIIGDVVHYDLLGFASRAAERLRRFRTGGASCPADEAVVRWVRGGSRDLRMAVARQLGASDPALLAELLPPDA